MSTTRPDPQPAPRPAPPIPNERPSWATLPPAIRLEATRLLARMLLARFDRRRAPAAVAGGGHER
jgi:hypothetical protein